MTHRVPFPFAKVLASSGGGEPDKYRWKAGIRWSERYRGDDSDALADGVGAMLLVEIGRYTPPGFGERVFFTRQFELPDGTVIGKPKLKIMGAAGYTRLCRGYRYSYELTDELANVAMEQWISHADHMEALADAASY